ncbi:MAG TPA: replication initiation protein [Gammaproteobacteria bacterium]|nr:replication initiation protein [Gammaproteobacteria bacterium]
MEIKEKKIRGNFVDKNPAIILKKHVGLIHCENKLTLMQRKICNILLFNALDKIDDQDIHEISQRQLCSLIGYNSNDVKLIKQAIKSLIAVVMEWNLLEDNKFLHENNYSEEMITWNASSLLAGASIRNGIIQYSYSPQIKSVLSSLDIYGRINLFVQAKFNSTYSLVLYENCVRFKNIKQTTWFQLELFRSLMGVSNDKYSSFKEFKRNVINVAVNEVNQKSDICITPQFRKTGKSITAIQFLLSENENYQPVFKRTIRTTTSTIQQQSMLIGILTSDFALTTKQAQDIISQYTYDFVMNKINLIKSKKKVDHPGAYLLAALKNDYQKSEHKIKKLSIEGVENTYLREAKEASEIQSLKNKYMLYKTKMYKKYVQLQAEDLQNIIKEKFEQYLKPHSEVFRLYNKSGLSSPFVIANFIEFIEKHFYHLIKDYLSFDDYITSEEI